MLNDDNVIHLLKGIVAAAPVEYIYLHADIFAGNAVHEMLIMVPFKQVRILNELTPVLNIVFNAQTEFSYRLFHVHEVKQVLMDGSLYFYYAAAPQNCLFSKSGSFLSIGTAQPVAALVKNIYRKEVNKALNFLSGAKFYFKQQNFEYCTFMLHQVFDLMYRAIAVLVMGKDKKTHRIYMHQQYVGPYIPALTQLFNENDDALNLLHLLDEAYLAVRYENNYKIPKEDVICLFEKVDLLNHIAEKVYQGIMNKHFDRQVTKMLVV